MSVLNFRKGRHHAALCTYTNDVLHLGRVGRYLRSDSRSHICESIAAASHWRISDPACWLSGSPCRCNVEGCVRDPLLETSCVQGYEIFDRRAPAPGPRVWGVLRQ